VTLHRSADVGVHLRRHSPLFSVLITTYNRQDQIKRCIGSCTRQTFDDFEIVVVDDASTDDTAAVLGTIADPRLRVVTHPTNRGISAARATAVDHARGEWLVMLDSDWELVPDSLARLRALIDELPEGVCIIRSRLEWDDGTVSPDVMPTARVTDYHGRLEWLEALAATGSRSDAGHCIHRTVLEEANYPADRRGSIFILWETDLAQREPSLWTSEVLGRQHIDGPWSVSRTGTIDRLLREAPDQLWTAEEMLARHGSGLACFAPHYRRWLLEAAAREAFLAGERRKGIRHTWAAMRAGASAPKVASTFLLGVTGARALATVKIAGRRWRAKWSSRTAPSQG
jgi:glycosyltransferase involved in cell wall biosynthesis